MTEPYRHGGFEEHQIELCSPYGQILFLDAKAAEDEEMRAAIAPVVMGGDSIPLEEHAAEGHLFGVYVDGPVSVRLLVGRVPDEERPQRALRSVRNLLLRIPSGRLLVMPAEAFDPREKVATQSVTIPPGDHALECWELEAPLEPSRRAPRWHAWLLIGAVLVPFAAAIALLFFRPGGAGAFVLFCGIALTGVAVKIVNWDNGRRAPRRSPPLLVILETSPARLPSRGGSLEPTS